jgi:F plasmid transfer operon, TraF, protein
MRIPAAAVMACLLALPLQLRAQSLDAVGTRAQGMGGAFVGVADDASAVYWNPAGLAGGAYFSLVIDGNTAEAIPDGLPNATARSGWLLALAMPALGLSYARLQTTLVRPAIGIPENSHVESLLSQHVGVTLVQSIIDQLAVGATVKLVRGIAAGATVPGNDREQLLDDIDLIGHGSNKFDLDIGVMAVASFGRAGLTIRNVTEPSFDTGTGDELPLQRQARAGGSVILLPNWKLAGDVDLLETDGPFGDFREISLGTEAQVTRRLTARAGARFNTAGDLGATPALSVGGSFAVMGSVQIDGQYTGGSDKALRGWGIAGRVMF